MTARRVALIVPLLMFLGFVALAVYRMGEPQQRVIASKMVGQPVPWHEQAPDVIEWGLDVNLKGALLFSHAVFGRMLEQRRGVIIGPQHPGAVLAMIVPPFSTGPSMGAAGSRTLLVNSDTTTLRRGPVVLPSGMISSR